MSQQLNFRAYPARSPRWSAEKERPIHVRVLEVRGSNLRLGRLWVSQFQASASSEGYAPCNQRPPAARALCRALHPDHNDWRALSLLLLLLLLFIIIIIICLLSFLLCSVYVCIYIYIVYIYIYIMIIIR